MPFKCYQLELTAYTETHKDPSLALCQLNFVHIMISWLPVYAYISLSCVLCACKSLVKSAEMAATESWMT